MDETSRQHVRAESHNGGSWLSPADEAERTRSQADDQIVVGLTAAVVAIREEQPVLLAEASALGQSFAGQSFERVLPSGQFKPGHHADLEAAIRAVVSADVGVELGYIEQLSTICSSWDGAAKRNSCALSIGYLALMRLESLNLSPGAQWLNCYDYLPWEDWRAGRPEILADKVLPSLEAWTQLAQDDEKRVERTEQTRIAFALEGGRWDDERVSDRYDLIVAAMDVRTLIGAPTLLPQHHRIMAAAMGRLRSKIRFRPVVFELLAPTFTLFELQRTVEGILGPNLHKQNFRRLVETTGLVEPTGEIRNHTGGRPAKLFRFRREVMLERPASGVRIKRGRAA